MISADDRVMESENKISDGSEVIWSEDDMSHLDVSAGSATASTSDTLAFDGDRDCETDTFYAGDPDRKT